MSLAEVLVAAAVLALALGGVGATLERGLSLWRQGAAQADAAAGARTALRRVTEDLREAGLDPTAAGLTGLAALAPTAVTVERDLDGDGRIAPPTDCGDPTGPSERVRYRLDGDRLLRSVNPALPACETPLAEGVRRFRLTYLDAADAPTADPARVRTVAVELGVADASGLLTATVASRVRLRNRP